MIHNQETYVAHKLWQHRQTELDTNARKGLLWDVDAAVTMRAGSKRRFWRKWLGAAGFTLR